MAKLDSVLRHAITPPVFDGKTRYHRDRLVDSIHANIPRKLIAIAAPPGYGKTTLLADFTEHSDLPVCWVRLTDADRDVMRFASVLAASLQQRFRRLRGEPDLKALAASSPEALARAFVDLVDARIAQPVVIILDDVHLVNRSRPVLDFMDAFLDAQPDQVTWVTAGREVLDVSLAKLMADGDLAGIGPHDLAVNREELVGLARGQFGVDMDDRAAEVLLEETRGWITGVMLARPIAVGGMPGPIQESRPMVYEYLASVVLNRQPDDLRRYMLDTAVLPIMTAAGCDHLLRRTDSQRFLQRLVREGLFVTATEDSPRTYEYHPQFRSFLLEVQEGSDPKRLRALRIRAADHVARSGSPEHAVELYVAAGAGKRAAELVGKHARAMFRAGRIQTLEDWSHKLEGIGVAAPEVLLYLSTAYLDMGRLELSEATLERATHTLTANAATTLLIGAETQRGLIALRKGEYDEAIRCADKADALITPANVSDHKPMALRLRAMAIQGQRGDLRLAEQYVAEAVRLEEEQGDDRFALAAALVDLSNIQHLLGKVNEAEASQRRAHGLFLEIGAPLPLAISHNNLAFSAHLGGRYEEALELFREGFRYARQSASAVREAIILFGQADLFSDLDLALQAAELYGQGLSLSTQMDNASLIRYGCMQTSVLHRRRGGSSLAHDWLRRAMGADSTDSPSPAIRVQLASLEIPVAAKRARQSLLALLGDARAGLDSNETALVHYSLAKAALAEGDLASAELSLAQALTWAGSHGSEQVIAAELSFDPELRSFARRRLANNPVLSVVFDRIETMRTVAQQYKSTQEEPDEGIRLEVRTLGQAKLLGDGQPLGELKPLFREVLAYLVDHRRVSRDELLEAFWPHYPPGRQVANLHTAIYGLRRFLGKDAIVADGSVYSLNPELSVDYDVIRFERAAGVAEGLPPGDPRKLFALTEAINSYGGTFLPEFGSEWVVERRRALEMRYLDLLASHADEALVRDQPLRAVTTLHAALKIDPYRDDTNLRLLEALGRLGRRSDIVAHYQRYVRLLAEELGLDPPQEVRELYNRLIV